MTAGPCSGCGHRGPSDARFCPRCGLPHLTDLVADAPDVARRVSPVERGRAARWPLIVAMVLAVGLLGRHVLEAGTDAAPSTASERGGLVDESTEPRRAPDPTTAVDSTTITAPPDEVDLVELAIEDIPGQSQFAALEGHHVFVAHAGGLIRFDTDTGEVDRHDRSQIGGLLVGHYRDQLILVEEQRRVTAVPAEDPAGDRVVLVDLEWSEWPWDIQAARMVDDHRLSLIVWSFAEPRGRAFVRLLIDLDARAVTGDTTDGWQTDDLAWVPGGGLFEFTDGSYRHLAAGEPVAAGRRHVLVHQCDGHQLCAIRWIDRQTGEAVDRPLPSGNPRQLEFLDPDDRVLFVNDDDGHRYFDAANGWFLPANVIRGTAGGHLHFPAEVVVGGRLLLAPIIGGLVVYDLDTHTARILDFGVDEVRGVVAIVAVPKPNRWKVDQ